MALSVKINGTTYRGTREYSIKQQGAAVSNTSLTVQLGANPVPLMFQRVQIYMDAALFFTGIIQKVGTPEYSSTYETNLFEIEVSSLESLLSNRLVTKNFYYYNYTTWTQVIQYIFTNYIAQENITLGDISTTAASFDSKYSVKDKKLSDVLNEIVDAIGNASWWISADRKFYFRIRTDFDEVTAPTHIKGFKLSEDPGDIRTVQKITGASDGINGTATNASLVTTIAARTGGSGKIEIAESNSDIHSDVKALAEAGVKLNTYGETAKTITCVCHDLAASALYNSWPLDITIHGVVITGDFVVVERTISDHGPDMYSIAVTLKNNNYFARYGYKLKAVALLTNTNASGLSDIASDEKLTASEKIDEFPRWQLALADKTTLDAEADVYAVSRVTFDAAFQALSTYLNAGVAWTTGTPAWFAGEVYTETTNIVGATYDANWKAFYDAKAALETNIRAAIQGDADAAIAAAHEASIKMSVSASRSLRSRAGVLSPASIIVSAKYGDNNTAYAGRFEIANSTDGLTYDVDYGIPNDPTGLFFRWAAQSAVYYSVGGGTIGITAGRLICTSTSSDMQVTKTGLSMPGLANRFIFIRIKQTAGTANPVIQVYYTTAGHSWSASYYKNITGSIPSLNTDYVLAIDMHTLTAGGTDWRDNTITGIRFDFGTVSGQVFSISDIYHGTGAALWYQSSTNESSKTFTLTPTSFGQYVALVRVRLYKAGGFVTLFEDAIVGINADPSNAAIYWGPLTAAPTVGIQVNDYYFDSNTVALGGGVIRYYTGAAWAEMTSAHSLWKTAWGDVSVLTDAAEWASAQGSVVAAATAIFDKLFASYIIAAYIFARQIEVPSGGRIRFYNGQGVQKRTVELAEDHIDWLDTPDTSPASDELLRGRIGRIGVGSTILVDGDFQTNIVAPWGAESVINNAASSYSSIIILSSGTIICAYVRDSDSYLVQRTSADNGATWSSAGTINGASCGTPTVIQLANGSLLCTYVRNSDSYLVKRTSTDNGATWSAESVINSAISIYPTIIQLANGNIICAYRRNSDSYLVQRTSADNGATWSAETIINASNSSTVVMSQLTNGTIICAYVRYSDSYLVQRTSADNGATWSAESTINGASSDNPSISKCINGVLICSYWRASDSYIVERTSDDDGATWSAEIVINASISYFPTVIQLANGNIICAYVRDSDSYLVKRTLQRYARLAPDKMQVYCAYKNQVVTAAGTALRYTTLKEDLRGCYDTSNGRFTAPFSGYYMMSGATWQAVNGSQLYPQINGTTWRVVAGMGTQGGHRMAYSFIVPMLAGQYMTMLSSGTTTADADGAFEIVLLGKM